MAFSSANVAATDPAGGLLNGSGTSGVTGLRTKEGKSNMLGESTGELGPGKGLNEAGITLTGRIIRRFLV